MKRFLLPVLIISLFFLTACNGRNMPDVPQMPIYDKDKIDVETDGTIPPVSAFDDDIEAGPHGTEISSDALDTDPVIFEPKVEYTDYTDYLNSLGREEPEGDFQKTLVFPDRLGFHNNALFVNSICGFKCYKDQGAMYITLNSELQSFSMFINNIPVDVEGMIAGNTYLVDIKEYTVNGENTVQISDITPADLDCAVVINILYPTLLDGKDESVIDPEAFEIIDAIVKKDIEYGFSSAQLSVIKDGKLIYENAWGSVKTFDETLNKVTDSNKADTDTLYDLASNTKMYSVNYAVQYLVSNNEMSLTDKVCDYIGDRFYEDTVNVTYNGSKPLDLELIKEYKKNLTIEDLLRHQAGFPASPKYEIYTYDFAVNRIGSEYVNPLYSGCDNSFETRERTLESICKTPLMYEPRTRILYSDVDFMLLCFILEEKTGKRLDEFLKEIFYDPLSLYHITYNPLDNGFAGDNIAATELKGNTREGMVNFDGIRTYTLQGEVHDEMAYYAMAGISGHAGLFSNATDLCKLAYVMLSGGYEDKRFFSEDVMDYFTAPNSVDSAEWGTGWWRNGDDKRPWYFGSTSNDVFGHQGWTGTLTYVDPSCDLVVVYLTNKINTPLVNKTRSTSLFEGGAFTSGSLGFVTPLLYAGLTTDPNRPDEVYSSMLSDAVSESLRLTADNLGTGKNSAAVKNAYSKMDVLLDRAEKLEDKDLYEISRNRLSEFDPVRDEEMIAEFEKRIK